MTAHPGSALPHQRPHLIKPTGLHRLQRIAIKDHHLAIGVVPARPPRITLLDEADRCLVHRGSELPRGIITQQLRDSLRIQTIKNAREAGLRVCSGGIFGLGETWEQRIELALTLKGLAVDSIPVNFLTAIP